MGGSDLGGAAVGSKDVVKSSAESESVSGVNKGTPPRAFWWLYVISLGVISGVYVGSKHRVWQYVLVMSLWIALFTALTFVIRAVNKVKYESRYYVQFGALERLYTSQLDLLENHDIRFKMTRGDHMPLGLTKVGREVMRGILNVTNVDMCTMYFESDIWEYIVVVDMTKSPSPTDWKLVESIIRDASWCYNGSWPRFVSPRLSEVSSAAS